MLSIVHNLADCKRGGRHRPKGRGAASFTATFSAGRSPVRRGGALEIHAAGQRLCRRGGATPYGEEARPRRGRVHYALDSGPRKA